MRDMTSQAATNARQQRFAIGLFFLRHGEGGQECRRARMNAGARLAHIVELKGVGHDAVREGRLRRLRREPFTEDGRTAAYAAVAIRNR